MTSPSTSLRYRQINSKEFADLAVFVPGSEKLAANAELICDGGFAFVYEYGAFPFGMSGVFPLWKGVGQAWVFMPEKDFKHPLFAARVMKETLVSCIKAFNLHRVQMTGAVQTSHNKWAEVMGFSFEGIMRNYTSDKKDLSLYALTL